MFGKCALYYAGKHYRGLGEKIQGFSPCFRKTLFSMLFEVGSCFKFREVHRVYGRFCPFPSSFNPFASPAFFVIRRVERKLRLRLH